MYNKIKLTDEIVDYIRNTRTQLGISAKKLTEMCGQRPGWITNIENKRTTTISKENGKKLGEIFRKLSEEREFEAYLEQQIALYEDDDYLEFKNREYESLRYTFKNQAKELRRNLTLAHKSLLHIIEKIDFTDSTTIEKYQRYINTCIGLLTHTSGKNCFSRLFKYPLHKLDDNTIDKIEAIIKAELLFEYKLTKEPDFDEYMLSLSLKYPAAENPFE